ncbi:MAG: hypothetical protein JWM28_3182, partial [Chitinophagaceae bacterium]|nr:hypothetical protein [Chitinophagaceae bacterium]
LKYVEAFVMDMKADTANINRIIKADIRKGMALDSLLKVSKMDLKQPGISKMFIGNFIRGVQMPRLTPSNSAITQLKNTGSLRLLTHKGAIDSILKYESLNQTIIDHNEIYRQNNNLVWESSYPIIDARIFEDTTYVKFFQRALTDRQTPPLYLNEEKLHIFLGLATRESLFNKVSRSYVETQLQRATVMLAFFEREYHIENKIAKE